MINLFWFSIVVLTALASSYYICRIIFLRSQIKIMISILIFFLSCIISVHIAGTLELLNILSFVTLPTIAFFQILLFGCMVGLSRRLRLDKEKPIDSTRIFNYFIDSPRYIQASSIILIITMGIFTFNLLTGYPKGYDALTYQFLIAVRWLQDQSLRIPPTLGWQYSLPGNANIGMLIMMSSGLQSLTTLMNIIASCIAGCGTYAIAYKLSSDRPSAQISTLVFLTIPIVQFQTFTGYVDLFGAAFIIAGIGIFLYRHDTPHPFQGKKYYSILIFLSGCAWGIAVGTKQTYFVYGFMCLLGSILTIVYENKSQYKFTINCILLLMIGLLIPSFFWFFRAFVSTGNPLHPISIQLSQWMIPIPIRPDSMMPGEYADTKYVRSIIEWFIYPWAEYQKGGTFSYNPGSGVGAAFATLITVCVSISLFSVIKNWRQESNRLNLALFSGFVVMLVFWWFVLDRVPRFMIPALALACGLSAPILSMLIRANSLIFKILVLSSVSITCALLIAMPSYQLYARTKYGFWQRSSEYHYPPIIDQLPEGSVIWNRGHELHNFPLAGDRLSNRVIPTYWGKYSTAQEFLKKEKVDYIATSGGISCDDCSSYGSLIYQDKMTDSAKIYHNWLIWKVDKKP